MDEREKKLLDIIQSDFPIEAAPYAALGEKLSLSGDEAFDITTSLLRRNLIRKIGPFYDSRRLGFKSTLVAVEASPEEFCRIIPVINGYREVTHHYERAHRYNLWFTLIAPSEERIETIIEEIRKIKGVRDIRSLPAEKMFKIRVDLPFTELKKERKKSKGLQNRMVELTEREKALIICTQGGIPLQKEPYEAIGRELGEESDWIIAKLRDWGESGIIRRFGAAVKHEKAGFIHNAMVVWRVDDSIIDRVGETLAGNIHVSHCYKRPAFEGFPYNLYTMIHAKTDSEIGDIIKEMKAQSGLTEYMILESVEEFKKSSPVYY